MSNIWTSSGRLPGSFELKGLSPAPRIVEVLNLAVYDRLLRQKPEKTEGPKLLKSLQKLDVSKRALRLKALMQDMYVDVSQNPARRAWTNHAGVSKCLTTTTCMYSFGRDRVCLPVELLFLQGHTREVILPGKMSQNAIKNLAGEGMCLPCLGSLLYCLRLTKLLPVRS